jgi:hypothetical protein
MLSYFQHLSLRVPKRVVITYDDVALYGAAWDAAHCLRRATMLRSKTGWTLLRNNIPAVFDGQTFLRADYERTLVFQAVACTIWNGEALQFAFSAGSRERIDQLFESLNTIRFQHSIRKGALPHPAE